MIWSPPLGPGGLPRRGADSSRWDLPALVLALGLPLAWGWLFPDQAEYRRTLILHGEWWRIWTGHFAHWGISHLSANLAGLLVLGWLLRRAEPLRLLLIAIIAAPAGTLALWLLLPEMEVYRGASGLVWAWGGAWLATMGSSGRRMGSLIVLLPAGGMLVLSPLLQMAGVAVSSLPAGIGVAWPVHLAGLGVGFACGWAASGGRMSLAVPCRLE